jgi:hypothetical protein
MSKRHQSSRRRTYGRRQHELHERHDRRPRETWFGDEATQSGSPAGFVPSQRSGFGLGDWASDWSLD